jgi:hypothetical protein
LIESTADGGVDVDMTTHVNRENLDAAIEISKLDQRQQKEQLAAVEMKCTNGLLQLCKSLETELSDVTQKMIVSSSSKLHFIEGRDRPESLLGFLKSLEQLEEHAIRTDANSLHSDALVFHERHGPCNSYVFSSAKEAESQFATFCISACAQLDVITNQISLSLLKMELGCVAVKVLAKMDAVLQESNDPVLCRQIGQDVISHMSACGLSEKEQQLLRECHDNVLKHIQKFPSAHL